MNIHLTPPQLGLIFLIIVALAVLVWWLLYNYHFTCEKCCGKVGTSCLGLIKWIDCACNNKECSSSCSERDRYEAMKRLQKMFNLPNQPSCADFNLISDKTNNNLGSACLVLGMDKQNKKEPFSVKLHDNLRPLEQKLKRTLR